MSETLGEEKTSKCKQCGSTFQKCRHTQKFCCRKCAVAYGNSKYDWKNRPDKELRNAQRMSRYYANRDAELQRKREFFEANPDIRRSRNRASYEKNKSKYIERVKAYRAANPDKRKKEYADRKERSPWKNMLIGARRRASKNDLSFDLTHEWARDNWTGYCSVSGLHLVLGTKLHHPLSPSIDRIIPALGYVQTNCRIVCFGVNSLRGSGNDQTMLLIARSIVEYAERKSLILRP